MERFNQDPLEIFFAQQRVIGKVMTIHSITIHGKYLALIVQKSLAEGSSKHKEEK